MLRMSVGSNFVFSSILPVRNPSAERAERNEPNAELLQGRQKLGFSGRDRRASIRSARR